MRRPAGSEISPSAPEIEQSILAHILCSEVMRAEIFGLLTSKDFYVTRHRLLWEILADLYERGVALDVEIIGASLNDQQAEHLDALFLSSVLDDAPAVDPIYSARKLKELTARRRIIEASNAIMKISANRADDLGRAAAFAKKITDDIENLDFDARMPVLSFCDFAEKEFPVRQVLLDPWLTEASINLISAWRGTGKTWCGLGILDAITRGTAFGPWKALNPAPCLYIDGELTATEMQTRARLLRIGQDAKADASILSLHYQQMNGILRKTLVEPEWRAELMRMVLAKGFKAVLIDNLSVLLPGTDENDKAAYDPIVQWLLDLRFAGVATILFHHVGKGTGGQRGTSGREDIVDSSVLLKAPSDYHVEDGCRFVMSFSKNRVESGRHNLLRDVEIQLRDGTFVYSYPKSEIPNAIWRLLDEGVKQKDIAEELGVTPPYVTKVKQKGIADGFLTKEGKLTQSGWREVNESRFAS